MTSNFDLKATQSDGPQTDGVVRWLLASVPLWAFAGFLYPFVAFGFLSPPLSGIQNFLIHVVGLSGQLADRVTISAQLLSLTLLLGVIVAAGQCICLRAVRPWARRWVLAAAVGSIASAAVWVLVSLAPTPAGSAVPPSAWLAMFRLLLWGALLGGLSAFLQRLAMRGRVPVPGYFVLASLIAAGGGTIGTFFLLISALKVFQ